MSAKLMGQVWELELPDAVRTVLLALADHADDFGQNAHPSIAYLVWKTAKSESTVQRSVRWLKSRGALEATANPAGGRGLVTIYRLRLDALPRKPSYEKGVTLTPFSSPKRVSPVPEKGVTSGTKRVSPVPEKGVTSAARKEEPSGTIPEPSGTGERAREARGPSPRQHGRPGLTAWDRAMDYALELGSGPGARLPELDRRTRAALGSVGAARLAAALRPEGARELGFVRREFLEAWAALDPP